MQFSVGKVRVHTALFHIDSADGSLLPLEKFGASIDAPDRDALAYHLMQTRNTMANSQRATFPRDSLSRRETIKDRQPRLK